MNIPFNKPFLSGKELLNIQDAFSRRQLSGNGKFTKLCHDFFQNRYGFRKCLLTTSCTDALEMAAILLDIQPGDEVIIPSFTFVSTANAFVLRGAKIVFADSMADHPNMDADTLESLITPKTRAIVPVHYAGVACDMDKIMAVADKYGLFVVEDAAQAIDSYHLGADGIKRPLGAIGHLSAFSFHETKNIISGEGGMLVVNDERFVQRAEIIWEKGTNRAAFWRGEVDKYGWVDIGSSYLPSEIIAAFLWAQLEQLDDIQSVRLNHWNCYYENLTEAENAGIVKRPKLLPWATNNAHMFYLVCNSLEDRTALIDKLKKAGIHAVFHYLSLHGSLYYRDKHDGRVLHNSDYFSDVLVRLPMFYELDSESISKVIDSVGL